MKLTSVKYSGFRCFGTGETILSVDDLTALIGNNGSGKTSALLALQKMFSEISNERIIRRNDFHVAKGVVLDDVSNLNLYIEAVFSFPELQNPEETEDAVAIFFNNFIVEELGKPPILRIRLESSWERDDSIEGSIQTDMYYVLCSESEEVTDDCKVIAKRHDLNKIRLLYIPAQRNPEKQLRNVSGSLLYRLLNRISWSEETKTNLNHLTAQLNKVIEEEQGVAHISKEIKAQWREYDYDEQYTDVGIQFNSPEIDSFMKKCEMIFTSESGDRVSEIDEIGDGLGSLFYFSLVESMLNIEDVMKTAEYRSDSPQLPILTILAIEEPENHIAPHLLGKLMKRFSSIGESKNAQLLLASHSPAIVKRVDPSRIRYFRKNDNLETMITHIELPLEESEAYLFVKEAVIAYPEIYFAKLVVLGEGESERLVISKILEAKDRGADSSGISVVPLGGRFVHHFWKLLSGLGIPTITLLDLDNERSHGGWKRIKYVIQQLEKKGVDGKALYNPENNKREYSIVKSLNEMDDYKLDREGMIPWIQHLEKYDVYFSQPLDLDFSMLDCFSEHYKNLVKKGEGPRIKDLGLVKLIEHSEKANENGYKDRVIRAVANALKDDGGDGSSYTNKEKQLMVWYNYFFLNRGKPVTHFQMLSEIDDVTFIENLPDELVRLTDSITKKIGNV